MKNNKATEWLNKNIIIDIDEKQKSFDDAIDFNKEVEKTITGLKLFKDFKDAMAQQEELNNTIKSIEQTKLRIISEAKIPVPGLTFDESTLYYNGLPFEKSQINTAQQIIVGLQINLALLKDIKIARFDGSLLDNENISIVETWAKENDLQLFVEFVDRNEEGLRIEIKEE